MVHMPFDNRVEAGRALAIELAHKVTANAVVLALPRGGVPVAFEVADRLRLPLDVVVVRKIGVPWQPELAMGAIAGNVRVLDEGLIRRIDVPEADLHEVLAHEEEEARRRESLYRGGAPPLDLKGKTAILVDDGLATGSSMVAAVRYVRSLKPAKTIVAVPVASRSAVRRLQAEADEVVCVAVPECFYAVGEWYREFSQVSDHTVETLLSQSRRSAGDKDAEAA
ncbi:MAG: phosphoribosyltransferase [Acidobacteriota bacterium]|nr:phosphoribosyltransferase [Acidobacteriota bacterium]